MQICTACKNEQASGKFCGKCGGELAPLKQETTEAPLPKEAVVEVTETPVPEESVTEATATQEPVTQEKQVAAQSNEPSVTEQVKHKLQETNNSEQMQKMKSESKAYFNYFKSSLKAPSAQVGDSKNSYINIALFILMTTISFFLYSRNIMGDFGPDFFDILSFSVITMAVLLLINTLSIFITAKLFTTSFAFDYVIKKLGNYYSIPLAGTIIGFVLLLIKSNASGLFVLMLAINIAFFFIPLFVVTQTLLKHTVKNDIFYAYLVYLLISAILAAIIGFTVLDGFIGSIDDIFGFYF